MSSRDKRALQERPAAGAAHWLGEEVGAEGVPLGSLPGTSAGPSSVASEHGSECDGWRRELGDGEVRENYMDAKFGGEDADMSESVTA